MKNKLLLLSLLIFPFVLQAQNFIPFQGIALDGSGKALTSKKIGIKISILKDGASGIVSYAESHAPTTDNNGLFQVNIGSGTALTNTFAAIDWSTLNYFLKLEMDVNGGTSYSLISTTKLGFVPFALYSTRSQNPAIYQNIGNAADTLKIEDNVTICETQDGSWRRVFKLPQPTALNGQLTNRRNTTILFNCKSTLSIIVSKLNSNLRDDLEVSKGEYVLFFFDGEKWVHYGGKTPQNDIKNNTYFGQNSLLKLTTANYNTAVGSSTLEQTTTGSWNTAVGVQALRNNTTGGANVAIGQGALYSNSVQSESVAIGYYALFKNTTGESNMAIGANALSSNISGSNNVGIGRAAISKIIENSSNTSIGSFAMAEASSGDKNTSIGSYVMRYNKGSNNIAVGSESLYNNQGNENIALGVVALYNNTRGSYNTALGSQALTNATNVDGNTAVGYSSLKFNTVGFNNSALGYTSLLRNISGSWNVAIGLGSLEINTTGSSNTSIGANSLRNNESGIENTAIGYLAGEKNNGSNNSFIGKGSTGSTINASNEITFGDANIKAIRSAVTSITSLSDARDKKNIQDLSLGLNFIQTLKPRSFQWDKREWYAGNTSDGSKTAKISTAGFIAQELDESQQKFNADWLNLVYKSNPEKLEANYGNLIPIIVKALQELNDVNKALMEENKAIKIEIEKLKNK